MSYLQVLDRQPFKPEKGPKLKRHALIFRDVEGTLVPKDCKITIWDEARDVPPGKYNIDFESALRVNKYGEITLQLDLSSLRPFKA